MDALDLIVIVAAVLITVGKLIKNAAAGKQNGKGQRSLFGNDSSKGGDNEWQDWEEWQEWVTKPAAQEPPPVPERSPEPSGELASQEPPQAPLQKERREPVEPSPYATPVPQSRKQDEISAPRYGTAEISPEYAVGSAEGDAYTPSTAVPLEEGEKPPIRSAQELLSESLGPAFPAAPSPSGRMAWSEGRNGRIYLAKRRQDIRKGILYSEVLMRSRAFDV